MAVACGKLGLCCPLVEDLNKAGFLSDMKILITDYDGPDTQLEQSLLHDAGIECLVGKCRTEEDVIAASEGCFGLLVQSRGRR